MSSNSSPHDVTADVGVGITLRSFLIGVRDAAERISEAIAAGAERFAESTHDTDEVARRYHWYWGRPRYAASDFCGDWIADPKPISGPAATVENQLTLSARAARAYDPGV